MTGLQSLRKLLSRMGPERFQKPVSYASTVKGPLSDVESVYLPYSKGKDLAATVVAGRVNDSLKSIPPHLQDVNKLLKAEAKPGRIDVSHAMPADQKYGSTEGNPLARLFHYVSVNADDAERLQRLARKILEGKT